MYGSAEGGAWGGLGPWIGACWIGNLGYPSGGPLNSPEKARTISIPPEDPDASRTRGPLQGTDAFQVGCVLGGKYVIERVLGEGGLGFVVAARHVELEQLVAIKYLRAEALASPHTVERFAREARLAGKIKSDHVVRVHDVGRTHEGAPYMVMEYLEGKDLRQRLEAGPLAIPEAIDYILQAGEALAEAHTAGIVHRDLKPDNLFLAKRAAGSEVVKVLDFGISKLREHGSNTRATDKFGTPSYMSPEQLQSSSDVDARADIWALGVILFELLTKTMPFDGDSLAQLCTAILHSPPPALAPLCPAAPPELEDVILKCLSKDRGGRFRNVAELAEELAAFAPPRSLQRVDHIVRVVREGGDSVRPPRLSIADLPSTELESIPPEAPTDGRRKVLRATPVTTDDLRAPRLPSGPPFSNAQPTPLPSSFDPVARSSRAPIVLGAVGLLLAIVLSVFALRRGEGSPAPATPAAGAAVAVETNAVVPDTSASTVAPAAVPLPSDPSLSALPAPPAAKPAPPASVKRPRAADKPPPSKDTAFGERL